MNFAGLLFESDESVTPLTLNLNSSDYVVPDGKRFMWLQGTGTFLVDEVTLYTSTAGTHWSLGQPLQLQAGDVLSTSSGATWQGTINGYEVDEDYFVDCGGGGSGASPEAEDSSFDEIPDCLEDTTVWVGFVEPNCDGWGGLVELTADLARYITIESSCTPWGGGTLRITLPESAPCNGYVTTVISPEMLFTGSGGIDVCGENVVGNQDVVYAADFVYWNGGWYRKD